jgi:hypothetical protein
MGQDWHGFLVEIGDRALVVVVVVVVVLLLRMLRLDNATSGWRAGEKNRVDLRVLEKRI